LSAASFDELDLPAAVLGFSRAFGAGDVEELAVVSVMAKLPMSRIKDRIAGVLNKGFIIRGKYRTLAKDC
jgi:hypothetical protein